MSAVLIISIFLLVVTSFAILRTKRSQSNREMLDAGGPRSPRSLFDAQEPLRLDSAAHRARILDAQRNAIRERARAGDFSALDAAHQTSDAAFYGEILDAVVKHHIKDIPKLAGLASYIVEHKELRTDMVFARVLLLAWKLEPEQVKVAELLRVAALADDAALYQQVVRAVFERWQENQLPGYSAGSLIQLFESEYWVLGSEAKRSGAGFVLKETLADVRRQLSATAARPSSHRGTS
ncbi:MAG TPA: hypothetical protein VGV59_10750 [Pyrinomonadaceae bacterium]|nr:hypothetical protein [Pyrinomonadaceae bacterium]